ncbi:FG-GAP-like repeat-containing protein [Myxococcota bacterium]|nr:FG-GAP-like repeat-containing protein [Myxococcota bacterium]
MNHRSFAFSAVALSLLVACAGGETTKDAKPGEPVAGGADAAGAPPAPAAYTPVQEPLEGEARPALLFAQAWFMKDEKGSPKPGPARLDILRMGADGVWTRVRLEDAESNVFHKAIAYQGGILTIGAEDAKLKHWTFKDGKWSAALLWEKSWGGKFDRLRDLEIGDVDGDGKDELVIATHDGGVVAVVNPAETPDGKAEVIEMDAKPDTFVHEIEIGDVDGDGKLEFFATPTDRNKANESQPGMMVMYRWNGTSYERSVVDPMGATHAKEILAADLDGDGKSELFSVLEAETAEKQITKPVEIRQYTLKADGSGFDHKVFATIDDRQTRFLVPGDFDGDGKKELVACAYKTGIYHFTPAADPAAPWVSNHFQQSSSGFEHACYPADLDGDGKLELYVAADEQREIKRYTFDAAKKDIDESSITWNIMAGSF